jgi:hypothetical protein
VPEPEDPPGWPRRHTIASHESGHATITIAAGVAVDEIAILDRMRAGDTRRCRDGHLRVAGVDTLLPAHRIMVLVAAWKAEHLASFRLSYPPPDRDWLAARGIVLAAGLDPFKGKGNPRRFARCRATLPGRCARLGGGRPSRPVADSDARGGWGGLTDEAGAFVPAWFWLPGQAAPRRRSLRLRSCRAAA